MEGGQKHLEQMCLCIFCFGKSESGEILSGGSDRYNEEITDRFLNLLGKYFGTEGFGNEVGVRVGDGEGGDRNEWRSRFGACQKCVSGMEKICDLYQQLEMIRKEMEGRMEKFVEDMELANDRIASMAIQKDWLLLVKAFRTDLILKCGERLCKSSPEVLQEPSDTKRSFAGASGNMQFDDYLGSGDDNENSERSVELKYSPGDILLPSMDISPDAAAVHEKDEPSGAAVFSCDLCSKQYTLRSNLRRHIRQSHSTKSKTDSKTEPTPPPKEDSPKPDHQIVCSICSKPFLRKSSVIKHLRFVHSMSLTKARSVFTSCKILKLSHPQDNTHQEDLKTEENARPFVCSICTRSFRMERSLNIHLKGYHQVNRSSSGTAEDLEEGSPDEESSLPQKEAEVRKKFSSDPKDKKDTLCQLCGKSYNGKSNTVKHLRVMHSMSLEEAKLTFASWTDKQKKPTFPCNIANCPEKFELEEHLDWHQELHGTFKCQLCDTVRDYAPHLSEHELEAHPLETGSHHLNILIGPIYECRRCPYTSPSGSSYKRHHIEVHLGIPVKVLPCDVCKLLLTCGDTDQDHFQSHHAVAGVDPEEVQRCDKCNAYFINIYQLLHHKRVVHELDDKTCPLCEKKFTFNQNLRFHLQSIHNFDDESPQLPVPCVKKYCKKRFSTVEDMEKHKTFCRDPSTKNVEPVKCPECGRECKGPEGLRIHMKSHKHPESYVCDQCGVGFKKKNILEQHRLFHKTPEEWDFQCQQCGKKCQTIYKLNDHMRTHTGEKPFECKGCGKRYAHRQKLRKHIASYHKDDEDVQDVPRKKAKPTFVPKRAIN